MSRPQPRPEAGAPLRLEPGTRIAAVVSDYHAEVGREMLNSAREELLRCGLEPSNWLELGAPGAFELPLVARRLALRDDVAAVLCFGLVLRGETTHDQHVAAAARDGLLRASLETDKPILFGVLTCDTLEQARARSLPSASGGRFDKGRELARAAIGALAALSQAERVGKSPRGDVGFAAGAAPAAERRP